jgi:hypothetical protein
VSETVRHGRYSCHWNANRKRAFYRSASSVSRGSACCLKPLTVDLRIAVVENGVRSGRLTFMERPLVADMQPTTECRCQIGRVTLISGRELETTAGQFSKRHSSVTIRGGRSATTEFELHGNRPGYETVNLGRNQSKPYSSNRG